MTDNELADRGRVLSVGYIPNLAVEAPVTGRFYDIFAATTAVAAKCANKGWNGIGRVNTSEIAAFLIGEPVATDSWSRRRRKPVRETSVPRA